MGQRSTGNFGSGDRNSSMAVARRAIAWNNWNGTCVFRCLQQWEIAEEAAEVIKRVRYELFRPAAQGEVLHNDDSGMRVLVGARTERLAYRGVQSDPVGVLTVRQTPLHGGCSCADHAARLIQIVKAEWGRGYERKSTR